MKILYVLLSSDQHEKYIFFIQKEKSFTYNKIDSMKNDQLFFYNVHYTLIVRLPDKIVKFKKIKKIFN